MVKPRQQQPPNTVKGVHRRTSSVRRLGLAPSRPHKEASLLASCGGAALVGRRVLRYYLDPAPARTGKIYGGTITGPAPVPADEDAEEWEALCVLSVRYDDGVDEVLSPDQLAQCVVSYAPASRNAGLDAFPVAPRPRGSSTAPLPGPWPADAQLMPGVSAIHGVGLFARHDLPARTLLGVFRGVTLASRAAAEAVPREVRSIVRFCDLDGKAAWLVGHADCLMSCANSSRGTRFAPNAEYICDGTCTQVRTIACIPAGTEVLIDYDHSMPSPQPSPQRSLVTAIAEGGVMKPSTPPLKRIGRFVRANKSLDNLAAMCARAFL